MKKIILILYLIVLCGSLSFVHAQDKANQELQYVKAMQSITAVECLQHVNYLAGRECAGRSPCDVGFMAAASTGTASVSVEFQLLIVKD